jgi:hypothetical protein
VLLLVWEPTTQALIAHCNAAVQFVWLWLLPLSGACTIAIEHDMFFFLLETGNAYWESVVSLMNRFPTIIDSVALKMV